MFHQGAKVTSLPGGKHMVDIDRLSPSTAYIFTVRASDSAGDLSAPSAAVPVTTPAPTPEDHKALWRPVKLSGRAEGSRAAAPVLGARRRRHGRHLVRGEGAQHRAHRFQAVVRRSQ
ncbi:hypothetical protein SLUN_31905 [Streptomyces lunaelactis]|uniref:Fibronectin type-III domain-containing protein n=1 Tax=Streptomyces lunaelactis TaxID=1535768 RepID=A0A2R4TAI7_9ACTN|nr:hypothetical protein SLUN_31905 [Streptomyces lunaelactis]